MVRGPNEVCAIGGKEGKGVLGMQPALSSAEGTLQRRTLLADDRQRSRAKTRTEVARIPVS